MTVCEHSDESFRALFDSIMALGLDEATAARYACQIGDTPIIDADGRIVVMDDHGKVIARLAMARFGG